MYRIIHPDGTWQTVLEEPTLERLQSAVDGYIERVPYVEGSPIGTEYEMYVNEDGIREGLPVNRFASEFVSRIAGDRPAVEQRIYGRAVVIPTGTLA
jgi:Domain of unknown function (DUF3846)